MKYTIAFLVCFSIASVTKIQFLLYPLTLLLSNSLLGFSKQSSQKGISRLFFQPLYIVPVLAICWYLYVINYNQTNCSTCFLTSIKPIWNLSLSEAHSVWIVITKSWYSSYYYPSTFHLIFLVVIICVVFFKKISLFNRIVLFLMFIGNAVYFILFYSQFNYHDYYFICFIPLIAFLFLAFNDVYLHYKKALNKYIIYALKTSLIVITVLSINYGRSKLVKRYKIVELGLETVNEDYYSLNSYLDEISVPSDALVISYPDHTCNATLYFMNRKGWTISETNFSKELIQKSIDNGAQYFVVNSSEVSNQVEVLGEVITNKVGQHGAIIIYRIEK